MHQPANTETHACPQVNLTDISATKNHRQQTPVSRLPHMLAHKSIKLHPCPVRNTTINTTVCCLVRIIFVIKINHQRTQQHTSPKAPFRVPPNETRVCAVTLDRKAPRRSWLCSLRKNTEKVAKPKIVQLYTGTATDSSRTAVKTNNISRAPTRNHTTPLFHGIQYCCCFIITGVGAR